MDERDIEAFDQQIYGLLCESGQSMTAGEIALWADFDLGDVERSLSRLADRRLVRSGFGSGGYEALERHRNAEAQDGN